MNAVWNVPYVRRSNWILRHVRAIDVPILLALSTIGSTVLTGFPTLAAGGWAATIPLVGSALVNFILILAAFKVTTTVSLRLRELALGANSFFWRPRSTWCVGITCGHGRDLDPQIGGGALG
jgi:hypothetical protein